MPRLHPNNLFLTGFMGVGKSTVGDHLARRLKWTHADSDSELVKRAGMDIAQFFKVHGEPMFRQLEARVVADLASGKARVVSLGGGALIDESSRDTIFRAGLLVYLRASPEALVARLDVPSRPVLKGLQGAALVDHVRKLLAERESVYTLAAMQVDTDGLSAEAVAEEIARRLGV